MYYNGNIAFFLGEIAIWEIFLKKEAPQGDGRQRIRGNY
jgi:hypothetical protein